MTCIGNVEKIFFFIRTLVGEFDKADAIQKAINLGYSPV
jgi:hypothetical protein